MHLYNSLLFVALIRGFAQATYETPIPLNVQYQDQFIAFTVQVEVENDTKGLGARQLLVDTGSSAMVFCDKDLANSNAVTVITYPGDSNSLGGTNVLDFGQANEQCNGGSFIISNSYGGNPDMYFYGYVYTGNVSISSHGSTDTKVIPGVAFTIAEDSGNDFICNQDKKIDGIWGVGFSEAGDGAFVMMPGFNDPSDVRCINQAPDSCSSSTYDQNAEWCFNEGANNTYFLLKTVLQKSLELKREYLTQKDWSLFGICLTTPLSDLSQLINSPITYNAAVAFGGSLAIQNNTCYNPDSIDAVVDSDSNGAFWTLPITSMHVFLWLLEQSFGVIWNFSSRRILLGFWDTKTCSSSVHR